MLPYMALQEANINNSLACQICQICQVWKSQNYWDYWEKELKNYE